MPDNKATEYSKELVKDYEVSDLPKLIVEQTYDTSSNEVLKQYLIHEYKQKSFKIDAVTEFLQPYARTIKKEEMEDQSEN